MGLLAHDHDSNDVIDTVEMVGELQREQARSGEEQSSGVDWKAAKA